MTNSAPRRATRSALSLAAPALMSSPRVRKPTAQYWGAGLQSRSCESFLRVPCARFRPCRPYVAWRQHVFPKTKLLRLWRSQCNILPARLLLPASSLPSVRRELSRDRRLGLFASNLRLRTIRPRPSATIRPMNWIGPLLLSGVVASCATSSSTTSPSPPSASLDVRALCQELTKASASSPELIDKDYFANCMVAHGAKP
jgi:hypothetical protein